MNNVDENGRRVLPMVLRLAVVSTAHIPAHDRAQLEDGSHPVMERYEQGGILFCPMDGDTEGGMPWLDHVSSWARHHDIDEIRFDVDADVYYGLPVYGEEG